MFKKLKNLDLKKIAFLMLFFLIVSLIDYYMVITSNLNLTENKIFNISKGQGLSIITRNLENAKIIESPTLFKVTASIMGAGKNMQAGTYEFTKNNSIKDIILKIKSGAVIKYKLTIPEGLKTSEILDIIKKTPNLKTVAINKNIKEGDLLPETYIYTNNENSMLILERMQKSMQKALNKAWESRDKNLPLKNKQELLTLASIIEKETSLDSERAEIAGVFINRLNKNMRLQSDPTVIYGLKKYNGNITKKHLRTAHPYNTYTRKGLPIGPICNPGLASLMAAAKPNKTNNIYFVANMKGGHMFAASHAEHKKNVAEYLKRYRKLVQKQ